MLKKIFPLLILLSSCAFGDIPILVSIAPQKFLVEQIGKERVSVEVIVPNSASSHTYEPTAKQLVSLQKGVVWFRLGESFERHLFKALRTTRIVDAREGIELIGQSCCNCHDGADPHIWLSARLLKIQARQIAQTLSEIDPAHTEFYQKNLDIIVEKLSELDNKMGVFLEHAPKTLLVSHPAYGYLCRDYGLAQLPIEMEGHEPSARYLTQLLIKARSLNIETVFLQQQHSVKGGKRIASELGAKCIYLDPYVENVIENLEYIAKALSQ